METCVLISELVDQAFSAAEAVMWHGLAAGFVLGLVLGWAGLLLYGAFQQYRATGSVDAESF